MRRLAAPDLGIVEFDPVALHTDHVVVMRVAVQMFVSRDAVGEIDFASMPQSASSFIVDRQSCSRCGSRARTPGKCLQRFDGLHFPETYRG
jgi:hypothetical protein